MEQVAALLLIVGCSADQSTCREVPVPEPMYRSVEACEAQKPLAMRLAGSQEPRLFSTCVTFDQTKGQESAELTWALTRGGELTVEIGKPRSLVATR